MIWRLLDFGSKYPFHSFNKFLCDQEYQILCQELHEPQQRRHGAPGYQLFLKLFPGHHKDPLPGKKTGKIQRTKKGQIKLILYPNNTEVICNLHSDCNSSILLAPMFVIMHIRLSIAKGSSKNIQSETVKLLKRKVHIFISNGSNRKVKWKMCGP